MTIDFTLANICTVIGECGVLAGVLIPVIRSIKKIKNGTRCQLRSDMLGIYYRHKDHKAMPQFEYENFDAMYNAYKALGGNSFVDKLYKDIQKWDVATEDLEEDKE